MPATAYAVFYIYRYPKLRGNQNVPFPIRSGIRSAVRTKWLPTAHQEYQAVLLESNLFTFKLGQSDSFSSLEDLGKQACMNRLSFDASGKFLGTVFKQTSRVAGQALFFNSFKLVGMSSPVEFEYTEGVKIQEEFTV